MPEIKQGRGTKFSTMVSKQAKGSGFKFGKNPDDEQDKNERKKKKVAAMKRRKESKVVKAGF